MIRRSAESTGTQRVTKGTISLACFFDCFAAFFSLGVMTGCFFASLLLCLALLMAVVLESTGECAAPFQYRPFQVGQLTPNKYTRCRLVIDRTTANTRFRSVSKRCQRDPRYRLRSRVLLRLQGLRLRIRAPRVDALVFRDDLGANQQQGRRDLEAQEHDDGSRQ